MAFMDHGLPEEIAGGTLGSAVVTWKFTRGDEELQFEWDIGPWWCERASLRSATSGTRRRPRPLDGRSRTRSGSSSGTGSGYRKIEAGDRTPRLETYRRISELYGCRRRGLDGQVPSREGRDEVEQEGVRRGGPR
jgi:hypothetical protein